MPRSPRSRGKGSRRGPWREGGANRKKPGLPAIAIKQTPPIVFSIWHEVEPLRLRKSHRDHTWVFAVYQEWNRPDGRDYRAFLFRDRERTVYGVKEWFTSSEPGMTQVRKLASRVVVDSGFRATMISEDPDLEHLWRRH